MRVDSSESEVRQDGMLPADEKSMLFAFVFPEVKTNTKEKGKGVKAVARFFVLAGLPHILKGGKA